MSMKTDWEAIRRDYRTDRFTLRELEKKHGTSYAAISRKAKRDAWEKDLTAAVKAATSAALLRESVAQAQQDATDAVLAAAELNRQIIGGHRAALARVRRLADKLLAEVEDVTDGLRQTDRETILAALQQAGLSEGQANALLSSSTTGKRLQAMEGIAQALGKLIPMERTAFGIGDESPAEDSFEEWLRRERLRGDVASDSRNSPGHEGSVSFTPHSQGS